MQAFLLLLCLSLLIHVSIEMDIEESVTPSVTVERVVVPAECPVAVKEGDKVILHYTGRIHESSPVGSKGAVFESSKGSGRKPLKFEVGSPSFLKGLSLGVIGMCEGERRKVVVPPELGYGSNGNGRSRIPGGAVLEFDVELLGFKDAPAKPQPNVFQEMDTNGDRRITYDEMEIWFQTKHPKKHRFIPRGVWEKDDVNQDKIITWEEFSGPKGEQDALHVESSQDKEL